MATLQQQARALGDPTRHAVFRHVADAGRPVGVAELTARFAFNHNAIRQHLAKLVAAGLVLEEQAAPSGRGRPRLLYVTDPAAAERWGATGPYERLSRLLVEIIRTGTAPAQVGREAAADLRTPPSGDAVADITDVMARQGFAPEVRRRRGTGVDLVLARCPFEAAATDARETICALHLGIAEGLAQGTDVVVEELVAYEPRHAGCRLRLRVVGPHDDAEGTGAGAHDAGRLTLRRGGTRTVPQQPPGSGQEGR